MKKNYTYIILPAYNEENNIKKLLRKITYYQEDAGVDNYQIVVVNDGSTDNTLKILLDYEKNKFPLKVINHANNMGLGETINTGFKYISEISNEQDIVIVMDADDTHTPGLIYRMINKIREGFDVIIASRFHRESRIYGLSSKRKILSWCASIIFRIVMPIKGVKDYTCGYRAYKAYVIKNAFKKYEEKFIDQQGFQAMVDILLKLRPMNFIFGEVPFILRYDFKESTSKMKVKQTIINTIKLLIKRRFERKY